MPKKEREVREGSLTTTIGWILLIGAVAMIIVFGFKSGRLAAAGQDAMKAVSTKISAPVSRNES